MRFQRYSLLVFKTNQLTKPPRPSVAMAVDAESSSGRTSRKQTGGACRWCQRSRDQPNPIPVGRYREDTTLPFTKPTENVCSPCKNYLANCWFAYTRSGDGLKKEMAKEENQKVFEKGRVGWEEAFVQSNGTRVSKGAQQLLQFPTVVEGTQENRVRF